MQLDGQAGDDHTDSEPHNSHERQLPATYGRLFQLRANGFDCTGSCSPFSIEISRQPLGALAGLLLKLGEVLPYLAQILFGCIEPQLD